MLMGKTVSTGKSLETEILFYLLTMSIGISES
jgi:hypothetical protein